MAAAHWRMSHETKAGFDALAEKLGFNKLIFADVALQILQQYLAKNPKIEVDISKGKWTIKVIENPADDETKDYYPV